MAKDTPVGIADLVMQARITNKLLVLQIREKVPQKELVKLLMNTGASDQEIADALNTTAATVSVTKARIRKEIPQRTKGMKNTEEHRDG